MANFVVSFAAYTDTENAVIDQHGFGNKIVLFRMPEISPSLIRKQAAQFAAFPDNIELIHLLCPTRLFIEISSKLIKRDINNKISYIIL